MKINRRLMWQWLRFLDESFEDSNEDGTAVELSNAEAKQCMQNGVSPKMACYDFINTGKFLVVGYKDYPQKDYFLVVNVYIYNDEWHLCTEDYLKDQRIETQTLNIQLKDAFNHIKDDLGLCVWATHVTKNTQSLLDAMNDSEWHWRLCSNIAFYFKDATSLKQRSVLLDQDNDMSKAGDAVAVIWYQTSNMSAKPIEELFIKLHSLRQPRSTSRQKRSYFESWQSQPGNSLDDITAQLGKKIDARINEVFGDYSTLIDDVLKFLQENDSYTSLNDLADHFNLYKLVDRKAWWDLISDQTYKAAVSRSLASHEGRLSRGVSLKTLRECLDKICYDVSVLWLQSFRYKEIVSKSEFCKMLWQRFLNDTSLDFDLIEQCAHIFLIACGSFVDSTTCKNDINQDEIKFSDTGWMVADSDLDITYRRISNVLSKIDANEDDPDTIVAAISQIIDVMHDRGSLAGVFIEGGAKTCDQVSSMKSGEIYEASKHSVLCQTAHLS